jgi:hypothetical protein
VQNDVGQKLDGQRQVLVENLDVVARVLLGGERVELAANGIDRLRDVFRRSRVRALEEHVLDEMRDSAAFVRFVAGAAHEPHADRHRPDLRHRLGDETKTGIQNLSDNHSVFWVYSSSARGQPQMSTASACSGRI